MNKSVSSVIIHIVGCLAFLSLPVIFSPDFSTSFDFIDIPPFQQDFILHVFLLLFFYLNYYLLIPELYFKKKYMLFLLVLIIAYPIISNIPELIIPRLNFYHFNGTKPHGFAPPGNNFWLFKFTRNFFPFVFVVFISFMLKIYSRWKQVEQEKISSELSYLKAQINPHFLFNSLNSIYSLTIEEKAYKSSEAIIKLSHMMRYVLVDSQQEFVSLEKEINYISGYIELQKIRFGSTVTINYTAPKKVSGYKIAPLILIPFIENAFKYGVNPETHSSIFISLSTENDNLHFDIKNEKVRLNISNTEKQGIGISNTKNRLQLLYLNKHQLYIKEDEHNYSVSLNITLR